MTNQRSELFSLPETVLKQSLKLLNFVSAVFYQSSPLYCVGWRGTFHKGRDRARGNGFKLTEGRAEVRQDEEILPCEGGEAQAQVVQRSCGYLIPGNVQGQVGSQGNSCISYPVFSTELSSDRKFEAVTAEAAPLPNSELKVEQASIATHSIIQSCWLCLWLTQKQDDSRGLACLFLHLFQRIFSLQRGLSKCD